MSLLANSRFLFLSWVFVIIFENVGSSSQVDPSTIEQLRRASTQLLYKLSDKHYEKKTIMTPIHGRNINDYFDDKFAFRTKNRLREPYLRRNMEDQAIEDNRKILDDILFSDLEFSGQTGPNTTRSTFKGENIAICWIETTTVKEDNSTTPPTRFVIKEHSISFENSATVSEKYKSESDTVSNASWTDEAVNHVIDQDTKTTKLVNSTTINSFGNMSITRTKSIKCSSGPVVTKDVLQWNSKPSKKRVVIKIGPQFHVSENARRFNDSNRKNKHLPQEPSSRKKFVLRQSSNEDLEEDEDDCSEYGSCEYYSSDLKSEDWSQELCTESDESCWDSWESEDLEYYDEEYSSDESCQSGESCEFSDSPEVDEFRESIPEVDEFRESKEIEDLMVQSSHNLDSLETDSMSTRPVDMDDSFISENNLSENLDQTTVLPEEDVISPTDESDIPAIMTSIEQVTKSIKDYDNSEKIKRKEVSMTTSSYEYLPEFIETTTEPSTDYISSPETTAEISQDYVTLSDDDFEVPVTLTLEVDDFHMSDTDSPKPNDETTAASSEDYATWSDEALGTEPGIDSTTELDKNYCNNGTCIPLPPECRRTSSGEIECTVIIPNLEVKNYDKESTTINTLIQEESSLEDGYITTIETSQDTIFHFDSGEDAIPSSVEVAEEAETTDHVSGEVHYEQTVCSSEEKYATTESIMDNFEENDVTTDSSTGTEGQEYVDSTVNSLEGEYDTTDLSGSVEDDFTTSYLTPDSSQEGTAVEQDTSSSVLEEEDHQAEEENINLNTNDYTDSQPAIQDSKNDFILRVRIKLERVSRGKRVKEKLAVVEKNIELDDFDQDDKQNLLQRIKSLNQSFTVETIQALLNCSVSSLEDEDLHEKTRKELNEGTQNENVPHGEINEEAHPDETTDRNFGKVRSKRWALSVNGSAEELAKSGAKKVDEVKMETGRAIEQAIPEIQSDVNIGLDHVATKVLDSFHPMKKVSVKRTQVELPNIFGSLFNKSDSLLSARSKRSLSDVSYDKMFENHHADERHVLEPVERWSNKRFKNLSNDDILETVTELTIFRRL